MSPFFKPVQLGFIERVILAEVLLIAVVVFLVATASALTISPSKFNESVSAGNEYEFNILVTNSSPDEKALMPPYAEGECAEWITIQNSKLQTLPAHAVFTLKIPAAATNEMHSCMIYLYPPQEFSMVNFRIGFPVSLQVSGGTEPTAAPTTIITTTATRTPVVTTTTKPVTTTARPPTTTYAPMSPITGVIAAGAVLAGRRLYAWLIR